MPSAIFKILLGVFVGALSVVALAPASRAEPASSPDEPIVLSLEEALQQALENDLGIRVEKQDLFIRAAEITVEQGQFDPSLNARLANRFSSNPRPVSVVEGAFTNTDLENAQLDYELGLEQKLPTGADVSLQWTNARNRGSLQLFNPSYRSSVILDLTQPLLKNFGTRFNRRQILIARNNLSVSEENFRARVMDLLLEAQELYWDLAFQRENLKVRERSLQAALEVEEITREKVRQGLLAPVENLSAEADAAARQEEVIIARGQVKDVEDRLRRLIRPEKLREDAAIIPVDEPLQEALALDHERSIRTALEKRPELREARINLNSGQISLEAARNQIFPSLDLEASAGVNGLGESFGKDLDELTSRDFYTWEAGLRVSIPLGNRTARANLAKERVALEKSRVDLMNLQAQATVEVKEALRRVETDLKRMKATANARFLAEKKLEVETERFRLGLSTTHDVLEFQTDLAEAQVNELRAILDYNQSVANLERAEGTLLETHDIVLLKQR